MPAEGRFGTGMKFPPQVNRATGRIVTSSDEENIKESVYQILMTQRSERFLRPEFGSQIMTYTFMDVNVTMLNILTRTLREEILSQEPRISDVQVRTEGEVKNGCLLINIDYVVRENENRDNLVFPFYVDASAEEEAYEPEQEEENE